MMHVTGEDLLTQPGLRQTYLYVANSLTPWAGDDVSTLAMSLKVLLRAFAKAMTHQRSHPGGHFWESNYNLLYDLAHGTFMIRKSEESPIG